MVMSPLPIFFAPKVESSFNIMGDTTDKKSNRMKVESFNSIQNIKYALQALHPAEFTSRAIKVFHRDNKYYSPIDSSLVTNMRLAWSKQKVKQKAARDERKEKDGTFQIKDWKKKRKKDVAEASAKMAEEPHLKHQQVLEQAYKPSRIDQITIPTEEMSGKYISACRKCKSNVEGESSNPKKKRKYFTVI